VLEIEVEVEVEVGVEVVEALPPDPLAEEVPVLAGL